MRFKDLGLEFLLCFGFVDILLGVLLDSKELMVLGILITLFYFYMSPELMNRKTYRGAGIASAIILVVSLIQNNFIMSYVSGAIFALSLLMYWLSVRRDNKHFHKIMRDIAQFKKLHTAPAKKQEKNKGKRKIKNKHLRRIMLLLLTALIVVFGISAAVMTNIINFSKIYSSINTYLLTIDIPKTSMYVGIILAALAVIVFGFHQLRKHRKKSGKSEHSKPEHHDKKETENKRISDMKRVAAETHAKYETDLDKLLRVTKKFSPVKFSEIASTFGIDIKKAEEWSKILQENELASVFYPALGEPELKWKE